MDLRELIGLGGIPFIVGLVEVVKRTLPGLPTRYYPAVAVFWGIVLNLALTYLLGGQYGPAVIVGVAAGMGACQVYEYGEKRETPI